MQVISTLKKFAGRRSLTVYKFSALGVQRVLDGAGIDGALARDILSEVAETLPEVPATQHPLGFAHLELTHVLSRPFRTRLHVWTTETMEWADELGGLHDHTWELNSGVLTGGLTDTYLEPRETHDGQFGAFRIQYGSSGNETRRLGGRWALHEIGSRKVQAGGSYKLPPRVVHRTKVDSFPTSTLVVAKDMGGEGPMVFLPGQAGELPAGKRETIESDWMHAALQEAIAALH